MHSLVAIASLIVAIVFGGCSSDGPVPLPGPVTFNLRNEHTPPVFLYEGCMLDLTITQLADPPKAVGRLYVCPACDCDRQSDCLPVNCGACFEGPREVPGAATVVWPWVPVDMTFGMNTFPLCTHNQVLPAGQYRIDVPVYDLMEDAAAKMNARIATQTFDLPAAGPVVVQVPAQ